MKILKFISFLSLILFLGQCFGQSVDGQVTISGLSTKTAIKETTVVDLFKSFKEGKYKINFHFKSDEVNKRGVVLFDMKTTVKLNGKTIVQSSRGGWPWLPGDMFVPIEAFDLISGIQSVGIIPIPRFTPDKRGTPLTKANREGTLEMEPKSKSEIEKVGIMPIPKLTPAQMDTPLPKGNYEVTLEMVPSSESVKGKIKPLIFSFTVK